MSQKYGGRVMAILAVLYIGLFGVPFVGPGIFNLTALFNPNATWSQRVNLKPGIDIAGGTSLVYQIKASSSGTPLQGNLAEQVASALKKRVDPEGVRNLVWRPEGNDRLEIQIPRSPSSDKAADVRKAYLNARDALDALNVRPGDVIHAVEKMTGEKRTQKLDDLAAGSESRQKLFKSLVADFDHMQAAQQQIDAAKAAGNKVAADKASEAWAEAAHDYDQLKPNLEGTDLQSSTLADILDNPDAKARDQKVAELKQKNAGFPRRVAAIDDFAKLYSDYKGLHGVIDDASELKRLLRGSGVLEFHILADETSPVAERQAMIDRLKTKGPAPEAGDSMRWYPVDHESEFTHGQGFPQDYNGKRYVLASITPEDSMVHKQDALDWQLTSAYPDQNQAGQRCVGFEFNTQGANLFGELTGKHLPNGNHKYALAIVLDDKIISAPSINGQINGKGIIEGGSAGYSQSELKYLVNTLNAGSLPAQLADEPISERIISPQLGVDNLQKGLQASFIGLFVVAIFLIGYYYVAGIVAFFAVVMNLVIILGVLAMFGATFTLPSIAGIVLTVGTAVDANVLVFERLREEQHRGLSLKMALTNAYSKALHAIVDSNMTTAITSLFLYLLGSEEVKGFGLTLLIGICSSLFTALFVTKTIFGILISRFGLKDLKSFPITFPKWDKFLRPNIDWMALIWPFIIFSTVFITAGLSAFVTKSHDMFDIEFASGTSVQFQIKDNVNMTREQVIDAINKENLKHPDHPPVPSPGVVSINNSDKHYEVVTPNDNATVVKDAIIAALGSNLKSDIPSKYEGAGESVDQAIAQEEIRPIQHESMKIDNFDLPDASLHVGGAAIVLRNIDPPISPNEIKQRISRASVQPGSQNTTQGWGNVDVDRLDSDTSPVAGDHPVANAVVLVSDPRYSYDRSQGDWQAHVAGPVWDLIKAGVNKSAQLQGVSNFNPQVAADASTRAVAATVLSILVIMAYIWFRFGNLKYGTATVVALLHDTLATIGAIGLTHYIANTAVGNALLVEPFRINLTLVAAVLTVMGYSMIDTIVVFDRIREIRGKYGHISRSVINGGINETLSRTLLTCGITIIMVATMYICGGAGIHGFTFVLLVGILVGTYSSVAIAAPILLIGASKHLPRQPSAGPGVSRKPPVGQMQPVGVLNKAN